MKRFSVIITCGATLYTLFCGLPGQAAQQQRVEQNPSPSSTKAPNPPGQFNYSDDVHFTVAGVADTTNFGGHGSSIAMVTNKESVAKEAASLGKTPVADASAGSSSQAMEKSLREAASTEPVSFEASYNLGKWLVDHSKAQEAIPYLKRAASLRPGDYDSGYKLALAYAKSGSYSAARGNVLTLLAAPIESSQQSAELYGLLAEVEEQSGNPLAAVHHYQQAAQLNPSEPNLFSWGAELLLHHAPAPAIEVFGRGNRLFPQSVRMLAGLGAAWYALGSYDQAVQRLCEASDLSPNDSNPYLLIGKIQEVETDESPCVARVLSRFATLEPDNALANYYYAVSLSRHRNSPKDASVLPVVKSLLQKALHLDPTLGLAYLQLGIIYSEEGDLPKAISAYRRAIELTPSLEQAHYRLARAYSESGDVAKAHIELQLYERISKEKQQEIERQHHEVQQFVYQMRDAGDAAKEQ
jgi:tetratricopeptide (TPR) repeat protein